jgi:hypothetical protein
VPPRARRDELHTLYDRWLKIKAMDEKLSNDGSKMNCPTVAATTVPG